MAILVAVVAVVMAVAVADFLVSLVYYVRRPPLTIGSSQPRQSVFCFVTSPSQHLHRHHHCSKILAFHRRIVKVWIPDVVRSSARHNFQSRRLPCRCDRVRDPLFLCVFQCYLSGQNFKRARLASPQRQPGEDIAHIHTQRTKKH